jgi:hypothetical protein
MWSRPWVTRLVAIAVFCVPAGCLASAAPSAQAAMTRGGGAPPDIRVSASLEKQQQARIFLQVTQVMQVASSEGKCATPACLRLLPVVKVLAATQQAQIRNYFCGPATVSEMLAQMGKNVSQLTAARELRTTTSGTAWSDGSTYPVPAVLNRNQSRNDYVAVALPLSPAAAQIRTYELDLVADINHNGGTPLAGNAFEVVGGPHLAGNPVDQTIFHWFDIRGYEDSGAITNYEDSVHGASSIAWNSAVPAYSALASSTIVSILGARGYDW